MSETSGLSTSGIELTGNSTPDSRNCGASTIGMNWMIWSSVRANVERKMPRLTAPRASSSTTRNASRGLPAMWMPRPTAGAGSGPSAGTWTVPERPGDQDRDLDRGEQAEPERVPEDDLSARHRRGHEALERAAGALAQEAHAGEDVDEEVGEEPDDGRREGRDRVVRRGPVDRRMVDGRDRRSGRRRGRGQDGPLDRRDLAHVTGRVETVRDHGDVERAAGRSGWPDHDPDRRKPCSRDRRAGAAIRS